MVKIEVRDSSDPETRVFEIDKEISKKTVHYTSSSEAIWSPVAHKLFGFPWTEAVTVEPRQITVKKQDWVDWQILTEPLMGLLQEHFEKVFENATELEKSVEENKEPPATLNADDPRSQEVVSLLNSTINPQVASHGGAVDLVKVVGSEVVVRFSGGCQGCSQSAATLKEGVEATLMSNLGWIKKVSDETDHAAGTTPYY